MQMKIAKHYFGESYGQENRHFSELRPEERNRYFQELVSNVAERRPSRGRSQFPEFDTYPGTVQFTVKLDNYAVLDGNYLYFNLPFTPSLYSAASRSGPAPPASAPLAELGDLNISDRNRASSRLSTDDYLANNRQPQKRPTRSSGTARRTQTSAPEQGLSLTDDFKHLARASVPARLSRAPERRINARKSLRKSHRPGKRPRSEDSVIRWIAIGGAAENRSRRQPPIFHRSLRRFYSRLKPIISAHRLNDEVSIEGCLLRLRRPDNKLRPLQSPLLKAIHHLSGA